MFFLKKNQLTKFRAEFGVRANEEKIKIDAPC